jgi:5-formyltetrahydrofolate cyclo-ligase
MTPDQEKQRLRAEFRSLRRVAPDIGDRLAAHLKAALPSLGLEPFRDVAAGYWPLDGEADVRPALAMLAREGFGLALPVVVEPHAPLVFRGWTARTRMVKGVHGGQEPDPASPLVEPNLLLVPLVAFDGEGHRLGMGGGYYDRTLAGLRACRAVVAVGVGHARQKMDRLPRDGHDQRLDWILTEDGMERTAEP